MFFHVSMDLQPIAHTGTLSHFHVALGNWTFCSRLQCFFRLLFLSVFLQTSFSTYIQFFQCDLELICVHQFLKAKSAVLNIIFQCSSCYVPPIWMLWQLRNHCELWELICLLLLECNFVCAASSDLSSCYHFWSCLVTLFLHRISKIIIQGIWLRHINLRTFLLRELLALSPPMSQSVLSRSTLITR